MSAPILDSTYRHGAPKLMLRAEQMRSLPAFFAGVPDPRRAQGRSRPLPVVLAIATTAVLCGARGYKAISQWAEDLGQKARARFRCRYRDGPYEVPSRTRFRAVLIGRGTRRPLPIHGQRQPANPAGRYSPLLRTTRRAGLLRVFYPGARALGITPDLDHHRPQRLSGFSPTSDNSSSSSANASRRRPARNPPRSSAP
jgi:hypothetical protein